MGNERWARYYVRTFQWYSDAELETFINRCTEDMTTVRSVINPWSDSQTGKSGATFLFEKMEEDE